MAAYAALVSLTNTMNHILNHPRLSIPFEKEQMKSLGEKIGLLLEFIETNNCDGAMGREEVEDLERQIAFAAHAAEDVIEHHLADQMFGGMTERSPKLLLELQQIIEDIDSIKEKVLKIKDEKGSNDQHPTQSTTAILSKSRTTGKSSTVGFDDELMQLMDVLTGQRSSRQIVSIVGMGGTGKTTLASCVYESSLITEHFDLRAWATISQEYNAREILLQLLSFQGKFACETVDELGERLYKSLSGRRYLIILDDMWRVKVWDNIKMFFPDNSNGSRIVLTSRLSDLATRLSSFCIRIKFLDDNQSWNLFCQKVFGQDDCPPQLVEIGKEIVKQCKGLPLSIVVIGGLLQKSCRTNEYWKNVAYNMKSILNSQENGCMDVLYLSYNQLPAYLKPCFLYMGTYREDYQIRVSKVIKLWVALGFIKPNGVQLLEEIAEDYLRDLIARNLILVCAHCSNGIIKSCLIHDLVRELCLRVANKEKFFCVVRADSTPQGIDRKRCLIFHDEEPDKCRLPRVLSKEFDHWSLNAEIQQINLRHVTYVGYWEGSMLPSSISRIWNLQTLIIKTDCIIIAPLEIWKMPQLRHLKCYRILLPDPPQSDRDDTSVILGNLQTLTALVNFRLSEEACKRIANIKKLRLMYSNRWKGYEDGLYESLQNLGHLHKLESLNIWCFNTISSDELKNALPCSLKKLSLKGCSLRSMVFGSLPELEVLKMENCFSEVCKWSCVDEGFFHLKFLQIEDWSLKSWTLDSASYFPVLEKLVLVRLWDLNEIPLDIGEIPTLQLIRFEDCTDSAVISAMKIKEEQESFGNDGLVIQVEIYSQMGEIRFKEMVEMEGLSINKIHLEVCLGLVRVDS